MGGRGIKFDANWTMWIDMYHDCTIRLTHNETDEELELSHDLVLGICADYIRSKRIERLENMSAEEILNGRD